MLTGAIIYTAQAVSNVYVLWEINIWNAETGALVSKLDGKTIKEKFDDNLTFVYSPDGKLLAVTGEQPESLRSMAATVAKVMVGKLPKVSSSKTYVWKLEG